MLLLSKSLLNFTRSTKSCIFVRHFEFVTFNLMPLTDSQHEKEEERRPPQSDGQKYSLKFSLHRIIQDRKLRKTGGDEVIPGKLNWLSPFQFSHWLPWYILKREQTETNGKQGEESRSEWEIGDRRRGKERRKKATNFWSGRRSEK